jgi:hypothetical protein
MKGLLITGLGIQGVQEALWYYQTKRRCRIQKIQGVKGNDRRDYRGDDGNTKLPCKVSTPNWVRRIQGVWDQVTLGLRHCICNKQDNRKAIQRRVLGIRNLNLLTFAGKAYALWSEWD